VEGGSAELRLTCRLELRDIAEEAGAATGVTGIVAEAKFIEDWRLELGSGVQTGVTETEGVAGAQCAGSLFVTCPDFYTEHHKRKITNANSPKLTARSFVWAQSLQALKYN